MGTYRFKAGGSHSRHEGEKGFVRYSAREGRDGKVNDIIECSAKEASRIGLHRLQEVSSSSVKSGGRK